MKNENFAPSWKENQKEQYFYSDGNWIKCDEDDVHSLWLIWVVSENPSTDCQDGFTIYGYLDKK